MVQSLIVSATPSGTLLDVCHVEAHYPEVWCKPWVNWTWAAEFFLVWEACCSSEVSATVLRHTLLGEKRGCGFRRRLFPPRDAYNLGKHRLSDIFDSATRYTRRLVSLFLRLTVGSKDSISRGFRRL